MGGRKKKKRRKEDRDSMMAPWHRRDPILGYEATSPSPPSDMRGDLIRENTLNTERRRRRCSTRFQSILLLDLLRCVSIVRQSSNKTTMHLSGDNSTEANKWLFTNTQIRHKDWTYYETFQLQVTHFIKKG